MPGDSKPAVLINKSDLYLVIVPDHEDGTKQPPPIVVKPGEKSTDYVASFDAVMAYDKKGQPVDLQLLDMLGHKGKSAEMWKIRDGSHVTVTSINGTYVLDCKVLDKNYYIPFIGAPTPSSPKKWDIDMSQVPQMLKDAINDDVVKDRDPFGLGSKLERFLQEQFSANDAAVIYATVQERVASQKNPYYASEQDKGLNIG